MDFQFSKESLNRNSYHWWVIIMIWRGLLRKLFTRYTSCSSLSTSVVMRWQSWALLAKHWEIILPEIFTFNASKSMLISGFSLNNSPNPTKIVPSGLRKIYQWDMSICLILLPPVIHPMIVNQPKINLKLGRCSPK